ncbi:cyclic pyranopterin monophosphate synthase MoaC, partial [Myxococcota bacterium]
MGTEGLGWAVVRVFGFEEMDDSLALLPLAAQRALAGAGVALSLEDWRALPFPMRQAVASAGSTHQVDVAAATRAVASVGASVRSVAPVSDPPVDAPPAALLGRLGPARHLPASLWALLAPIERYALVRLAEDEQTHRLEAAYGEIVGYSASSHHVHPRGGVRMVNVSSKTTTHRSAVATSRVGMNQEAMRRLVAADVPKGDVLGTARLAGIMAAKRTHELIPLCHSVALTRVELELSLDPSTPEVTIRAQVEAVDRTGVEMEALVAASTSALTVYD